MLSEIYVFQTFPNRIQYLHSLNKTNISWNYRMVGVWVTLSKHPKSPLGTMIQEVRERGDENMGRIEELKDKLCAQSCSDPQRIEGCIVNRV